MIHSASHYGHGSVVKLLSENKFDINIQSSDGDTAMFCGNIKYNQIVIII